jgi:regulator of cell morphogenesis and NO signaling
MHMDKTIGQLALERPHAIAVLERWKIDYCCRGNRSVAEACDEAGISIGELMAAIGTDKVATNDWGTLTELQRHIVATHHAYTRQACETLDLLSRKVAGRHGDRHAEVLEVRQLTAELIGDLLPHMMKEEQILFPYVEGLENGGTGDSCFGTVANPVRVMMMEHERVGELLVALRAATSEYKLPDDACLSFRALYETLAGLERDLHEHIHLENNVLFPRALRLEEESA